MSNLDWVLHVTVVVTAVMAAVACYRASTRYQDSRRMPAKLRPAFDSNERLVGINAHRPPLSVCFYGLERYNPEDEPLSHKSVCPACGEGLLLMLRSSGTGELLDVDRCVLCAQQVRYLDIEQVRAERP